MKLARHRARSLSPDGYTTVPPPLHAPSRLAGGAAATTTWTAEQTATGAAVRAVRTGEFSAPRTLRVRLRRVDHAPTSVTRDGRTLTEGVDWTWDAVDLALLVTGVDSGTLELVATYDPALVADAPPVAMPLRVTLPAGTPSETPISIASHVDGWATQTALTRTGPTDSEGTLVVPRGEHLEYKYTRGSWDTVEKWRDCVEAENRYALGRAEVKSDAVYGWRDWCAGERR